MSRRRSKTELRIFERFVRHFYDPVPLFTITMILGTLSALTVLVDLGTSLVLGYGMVVFGLSWAFSLWLRKQGWPFDEL